MFAEAMTKHALHMVYQNEDLVDECFAHVHMIDPSWLTRSSRACLARMAGTMAEPGDLENSEDEDEQPREAPAEEGAPGSCSDGDQEDDNAAQSGDNHEDKEIADESVNVAREASSVAGSPHGGDSQENAVVLDDSSDDFILGDHGDVEI